MKILSPSVIRLERPVEQCAEILNALGCDLVHIDISHSLQLPDFFDLRVVSLGKLQLFICPATVHLFWFNRNEPFNLAGLRSFDQPMLHVFPEGNTKQIEIFIEAIFKIGCQPALSLDVNADVKIISPYVEKLKAVYIMGTPIGTYSFPMNKTAVSKLKIAKEIIEIQNSSCRLGIDGGVNAETFRHFAPLVDEIVIGGLLFNAPNLSSQWKALNSWLNTHEKEVRHEHKKV